MFIDGHSVNHMVDEHTHFCAARSPRHQSSNKIWKHIKRLWSIVYLGPPDYRLADQDTVHISNEVKESTTRFEIGPEEAPI